MWPFRRRKRTGQSDTSPPVSVVTSRTTRVVVDGEEYDRNDPRHVQMMQLLESATSTDIDGDGQIAGRRSGVVAAATVTPPPPPPENDWPTPDADEDDPLERVQVLERLVALRDSGALTDAEFVAEKARILAAE